MKTFHFPNGQSIVSSALSPKDFSSMFQDLVLQVVGVNVNPFSLPATLTEGQFTVSVASTAGLYCGLMVSGAGVPTDVMLEQVISQTEILLSSPASASGNVSLTFQDPEPYSHVRLSWPKTGAPAWGINQDVCFLEAVQIDSPWGKIRDVSNALGSDTQTSQTFTYTRVWEVSFTFYGPNSFDRATLLRSVLIDLDFAYDFLAANQVYLITDTPAPRRQPEEFEKQWWERTDFKARFNELVTETTLVGSGSSVQILTYTENGQVSDITVNAQE